MRRTAKRKVALRDAGNQAADRLVQLVGACEWCGRDRTFGGLVQHEIAVGADRLKARLEPCAAIIMCNPCHVQIHRLPMPERVLVGLAILYHARTADYSLRRFIELFSPNAPSRYTQHEVDLWVSRLTRQP